MCKNPTNKYACETTHIPINTPVLVIQREIIKHPDRPFFPLGDLNLTNQLNPAYLQLGFLVPAHFPYHFLLVQYILALGGKQLLTSPQVRAVPLLSPSAAGVGGWGTGRESGWCCLPR